MLTDKVTKKNNIPIGVQMVFINYPDYDYFNQDSKQMNIQAYSSDLGKYLEQK